jgi:hypothetical protein
VASYNTFLLISTKGKPLLVTSSARKARKRLQTGSRVEVWSANAKAETVYYKTRAKLDKYVAAEREYIRTKQEAAERRNKQRRKKATT